MSTQAARNDVAEDGRVSPAGSALRLQASERLAEHRLRRERAGAPALFDTERAAADPRHDTRAGRIAAAVGERYAHAQTYRAFLAAEAQRAHDEAERARAAAEVARRSAEAVAAVQLQLLQELEREMEIHDPAPRRPELLTIAAAPTPIPKPPVMTVRLYEVPPPSDMRDAVANGVPNALLDDEERMALDEEIAFRQAPVFEDFQQAAVPLPANLIEFPRHLVAARKARPRLAEGPLRDDQLRGDGEDRPGPDTQLRIFEVEPELISTVATVDSGSPEWSSIRLSACVMAEPVAAPEFPVSYPHRPLTAPLGLRVMATLVDGCIVMGASLGFVAAAVYIANRVPSGEVAALCGGGAFTAILVLYYVLFFTLSDATPGMRYARVGLCTLDDENPTRGQVRGRLLAMLLAACPLGLGFLWAFVDDEGLGWHDRISRMYPRGY